MGFPVLGLMVALTGFILAVGGCGDDEERPEAVPDRGRSGSSAAERLCGEYRRAVTEVRFNGSPTEQAKDFRAVAGAARAAREGTGEDDLGAGGRNYLDTLDTLILAYKDAAAAAARKDEEAFHRALDAAEPADEALDTRADRVGLERCSLDEPRAGESRVSQSGFPALILPKGQRVPPSPDQSNQVYPLGQDEAITLVRGTKIPTGTVSPARAARVFENANSNRFRTLEPTGPLGDEQAPMRGYRYEQETERGIHGVFSGQGHIWLMSCRSRRPNGPSPKLKRACTRAAETAGFLMF